MFLKSSLLDFEIEHQLSEYKFTENSFSLGLSNLTFKKYFSY